jgi:hypothetical protein
MQQPPVYPQQQPQYPQRPATPSLPRYLPPPPASAAMPVSPGPSSRVVPVYDNRPPAAPQKGGRNWLNAVLVVIALLAVAGAGTTVYLVELGKDKPAANSQTRGPETSATPDATQGNGVAGGITPTDTETTAQSHAPATTATKTETITMPDLTDAYVDYAKQQLRDKGFTGTIKTTQKATDDENKVGHVLSQDPKANKQVAKNGTVTLTIGATPAPPSGGSSPTGPRPTAT